MRVNKINRITKNSGTYFADVSNKSVKDDFKKFTKKVPISKPEKKVEAQEGAEKRIIHISENGSYSKFAKYIVGKLVRLVRKGGFGQNTWFCEFVFDDDRKALNRAAGWSDNKKEYLLDGLKFK